MSLDRQEKDLWIAAARREFVASPRSLCHVCGKFRSVAQAHHVVPLAKQFDLMYESAEHEHVWLCPTHHAIVHLLLVPRKASFNDPPEHLVEAVRELDDDHYQKIMVLLGRASKER